MRWGAAAVLVLALNAHADQCKTYEALAAYDVERAAPVDTSEKEVYLHIRVSEHKDTAPYRALEEKITDSVRKYWLRLGIRLYFLSEPPEPRHDALTVEVVGAEEFYEKTRLPRTITVKGEKRDSNIMGYADFSKRTIYLRSWPVLPFHQGTFALQFMDTFRHELGHELGLPHKHGSEYLMTPLEMSAGMVSESEWYWIHSFLDKGTAYRTIRDAGIGAFLEKAETVAELRAECRK